MVGLVGIDLVVAYIATWSDLTQGYCLTFRHADLPPRTSTNHQSPWAAHTTERTALLLHILNHKANFRVKHDENTRK